LSLPGSRIANVITGELKSKVDRVWDAFWSGGISNPLEVMEQITYLLFIRRLDELQTIKDKMARRLNEPDTEPFFGPDQQDLRWQNFKDRGPEIMYLHSTVRGMNLDNFLVRPRRREVETYRDFASWRQIDEDAATVITEGLLPLPSEYWPEDEGGGARRPSASTSPRTVGSSPRWRATGRTRRSGERSRR